MDTVVAFTREYSKVSISTGNAKYTSQGSRSSKNKDMCFVEREKFPKVSLVDLGIKVTSRFAYFGTSKHQP
jgi:hypothetical protein